MEEHKAKIGKSQSGKKQTPEHIEKRRQSLMQGTDRKKELYPLSQEQILENFRLRCKKFDLRKQKKKDDAVITALIYSIS